MDDLSGTEIFYRLTNIGVINKTKNVVIGHAGFLLCCKVFVEIAEKVALGADIFHIEGDARGGNGVDTCGVVNEIGIKSRCLDLFTGHSLSELIKYRTDHFHVGKFFRTNIRKCAYDLVVFCCIALIELSHRRADLAVRSAQLTYDDLGICGVGIFDLNGEL